MATKRPLPIAPGLLVGVATVVLLAVLPVVWLNTSLLDADPLLAFVAGQAIGIAAWLGPFLLFAVYRLFYNWGWVADPRDWVKRVRVSVINDFHRSPHGSWAVDLVDLKIGYNARRGMIGCTIALFGVNVILSLVVDQKKFDQAEKVDRLDPDEAMKVMSEQLRQAIESITGLPTTAVKVRGDDDEGGGNSAPVH